MKNLTRVFVIIWLEKRILRGDMRKDTTYFIDENQMQHLFFSRRFSVRCNTSYKFLTWVISKRLRPFFGRLYLTFPVEFHPEEESSK